jgi:hypothetical protein
MNTTETQALHGAMPEALLNKAAGRSTVETIGAIAAVVLAVIGLAGLFSNVLASIAMIVLGAAILIEGWAIGSSYRQFSSASAIPGQDLGLNSALTAEFLGGIAGIVLGILALFRAVPDTLLAVALLVYGATLLLSSLWASQAYWRSSSVTQGSTQYWAAGAVPAQSGQLLVGLGAVVLGILAVIGLAPMTLILVGVLSLAAVMLLGQFRLP